MKYLVIMIATIVVGIVTQLLVVVPSGSRYCHQGACGTYFWGANEHDAVWHLAVAERSFTQIPFEMPNMSETTMSGYNYLLDLSISIIHSISNLSPSLIYFKLVPIFWAVAFVYLSLRFARAYSESKIYPIVFLFFNFFGSSFAYLLTLRNTGQIWGSSGILAMQSGQNLLNVQFALSLLALLYVLSGLARHERSIKHYFLYSLCLFVALGLKFYTGAAVLIVLAIDLLLQWIAEKRPWKQYLLQSLLLLIFFGSAIMLFYKPLAHTNLGSPLIFKPLATVNPIIEDRSLLYLPTYAQRLYSYTGARLWLLEIAVLFVFLIFNFGSRVLAFCGYVLKQRTAARGIQLPVFVTAFFMLLFAICFVQRGVWWNTVQFLYVALFLSNIFAAEGVTRLFAHKRLWSQAAASLILVLTIPTNLDIIRIFGTFPGTSYISDAEILSLTYLRNQPPGLVLTDAYAPISSGSPIRRLPFVYDTSYITAYSGQQTYLSDLIQLTLTGVDHDDRLAKLVSFDCQNLENATYLYELTLRPYKDAYASCDRFIERIFTNDDASIYRIQ